MASSLREPASGADDDVPLANSPAPDQSLADIRVLVDETPDDSLVVAFEDQDRQVEGVGHGTGQHQLASLVGRFRQAKVLGPQRLASLEVVVDEVIEQQPVHGCTLTTRRTGRTSGGTR